MIVRNGSITVDKFNKAETNEEYIKYQILAPRINWASVLVVYVSPDTKRSRWVPSYGKSSTPTSRGRESSVYGSGVRRALICRKP